MLNFPKRKKMEEKTKKRKLGETKKEERELMHPMNIYKDTPPDFQQISLLFPKLKK